jgi:hypothetical protein
MRKVLKQSFPFVSEKSETVYRLVEEDGERFIEKVTTATSKEGAVQDGEDADAAFMEFLAKKQANRDRNKNRISTRDAFIRHHVHERSWRQIADEVGQKSKESIAKRVSDFTSDLASHWMGGGDLASISEDLQMSLNHLSMVLTQALERQRRKLLSDYEDRNVMSRFSSDVALVVDITNFLSDWDSFEYQAVSPFEEHPEIAPGKKVLFTQNFYEIHRESGAISRVAAQDLDGITFENWNVSPLKIAFGLITADPVKEVFDMFGRRCEYYTQSLSSPQNELTSCQ